MRLKVFYNKKTKQLTTKDKGVEAWLDISRHKRPDIGENITVTPAMVNYDVVKAFRATVVSYEQCSDDSVRVIDNTSKFWIVGWMVE